VKEELELRKREIADIEYQLADPDKTDRNGRRLTPEEYRQWLKKALGALRAKKDEAFELKTQLRQRAATGAFELFERLRGDGVEFTDEEWEVACALQDT